MTRAVRRSLGWLATAFSRVFVWLAVTTWRFAGDWRGLRPLLTRTSAHAAIIAAAVLVLVFSNLQWPALIARSTSAAPLSLTQEPTPEATEAALAQVLAQNSAVLRPSAWAPLSRQADPHTIIPERPRLEVITYTIQAGDTVQSIAARFRLEPTTIMWSNSAVEDAPDMLRIGQVLVILPVDGVYHTVAEGETLESIARKYQVEVGAITSCTYNHLTPPDFPIQAGMHLIIPGGVKPYVPRVITSYTGPIPEGARGSGMFQWPAQGYISQGYWYGHRAIDIAAPTGTAIHAADAGFVSFAGWTDIGYGYLIVVDHANGYATYYAHLSAFYVAAGQAVERGQVIGAMGSTGWSSGPHVHFEIRYNGVPQNPRAYLP